MDTTAEVVNEAVTLADSKYALHDHDYTATTAVPAALWDHDYLPSEAITNQQVQPVGKLVYN